jgi:hypothetical protein
MIVPESYFLDYVECVQRYSAEDFFLLPVCAFEYRMEGLHRNWLFCENHFTMLKYAGEVQNKSDEYGSFYDDTAGADMHWVPEQTRAWTVSQLTSLLENFLMQMSEVVAEDLKVSVKLSEKKMPLIEKYVEWMSAFGGLDVVIAAESYQCLY